MTPILPFNSRFIIHSLITCFLVTQWFTKYTHTNIKTTNSFLLQFSSSLLQSEQDLAPIHVRSAVIFLDAEISNTFDAFERRSTAAIVVEELGGQAILALKKNIGVIGSRIANIGLDRTFKDGIGLRRARTVGSFEIELTRSKAVFTLDTR